MVFENSLHVINYRAEGRLYLFKTIEQHNLNNWKYVPSKQCERICINMLFLSRVRARI